MPFFLLQFCSVLVGNFPRIQVVQLDYLNPTLGSQTGPFLEVRYPRRWDYAICRALIYIVKKEEKEEMKMLLTINEGPDLLVDGGIFGRVSLGVYGVDVGVVFEQ